MNRSLRDPVTTSHRSPLSDAPTHGAAAVMIRELRVVRGGTTILHDITLDVPPGSVYGLVGPSGSGKTTLMRAIVGLQRVASGTVRVLGRPGGSADLRRTVGYMPQRAAVYDDLSARENLQFFAATSHVPPTRVEEVLALVDLTDTADRPVATFSGGQRQRVSSPPRSSRRHACSSSTNRRSGSTRGCDTGSGASFGPGRRRARPC